MLSSRSFETLKPPPKTRRLGTLLAAAILGLLAFLSINRVENRRLDTDPGIFAAMGLHLLQGKVLYRDVWDHKPPLVFALNALALKIGQGDVGMIRTFERVFGILAVWALFFTALEVFHKRWMAFLGGLLFLVLFYHPLLLGSGNYTEEYGASLSSLGILASVVSTRTSGPRRGGLFCLAGFCFGLAAMCKEPFVFSSVTWFLYGVLSGAETRSGRPGRAAVFLFGALLPVGACAFVLSSQGALIHWLDTLDYGFRYSETIDQSSWIGALLESQIQMNRLLVQPTHLGQWLAVAGTASCLYRPFLRTFGYFPLIALCGLYLDFMATILSNRYNAPYYLQCAPCFILLATSGLAFLLYWVEWIDFKWGGNKRAMWVFGGVLALFILFDHGSLSEFLRGLSPQDPIPKQDTVLEAMLRTKGDNDRLWMTTGHTSYYYVETGMVSPARHLACFDHHFIDTTLSTGAEKKKNLIHSIQANPPRFVITSTERNSEPIYWALFREWFEQEYELTGYREDQVKLWVRKKHNPFRGPEGPETTQPLPVPTAPPEEIEPEVVR